LLRGGTMLRLPLLFTLCCAVLPAQRALPEVTDLLAVAGARSRGGSDQLVRRAALSGDCGVRHVVAAEGQWIESLRAEGSPVRPYFSAATLVAQLEAMRSGLGADCDVLPVGARMLLRSPAVEQVDAALIELRRTLPAQLRCRFRLERITDGGAVVVLGGEERFDHGELVAVGDVERRTAIADIDVEIAQAAACGNPVPVELQHGSSVLLRARPLPGRDAAVVEAFVRVARPADAGIMPGSGDLGAFHRVECRFDEAGVVFRAARGNESRHEWTTLDGQRLALVCQLDWTPPAAAKSGGAWLSPLLHAPVLGFRSGRATGRDEPAAPAPDDLVLVDELASALLASDSRYAAAVAFVGDAKSRTGIALQGDAGQQFAAELDRRIDDALTAADVAIEAFDAPAGVELPASGAPPAGVRALWSSAGPAVVGLPSCFASGREFTYVRDWDVEVAQGARIADPKVDVCEHGWFATVKVLPAAAGGPRRIELVLDRTDFVTMAQLEVPLAANMVGLIDSGHIVLPPQIVKTEQAVTRSITVGGAVELDAAGVAVVRRAAAQLLGPGRELLVRLRVR
jgi:hypothetical protein